jgi:hypothetical protein
MPTSGPAATNAPVAPNAPATSDALATAKSPAATNAPAATSAPDEPMIEPRVRVIATKTAPLPDASDARPTVDEHQSSVPTPATEVAAVPVGPVQPPSVVTRAGTIPPSDVILPPAPINGVRTADPQALLTMWTEDTIPLDRVESKFKVMTPNVGDVRVTLKSKDVFEGRLYAVGENSVWLEGPYGRMGMDITRIATVEKVGGGAAGATGGGDAKVGAFALNERVRVPTQNGPVYGRVLSAEGTMTKIVTDDGIKMSAETKLVERVESLPKVVVKKEAPTGN